MLPNRVYQFLSIQFRVSMLSKASAGHSTPKAKKSPTLSTINETNVIQTFLIVSLNIEKDLKILGVFLKLGFSMNLLDKIKEF